jgi:hypothetical protein
MSRRTFLPRHLAPMLAALALLARMLVPAGFMPMASAQGLPTLVICPGAGPRAPMAMPAMTMAMPGMTTGQEHKHHDAPATSHDCDHACPFGTMAAVVDLASLPPLLPFPLAMAATRLLPSLFARPGLGLAAPPPPKTGPPFVR